MTLTIFDLKILMNNFELDNNMSFKNINIRRDNFSIIFDITVEDINLIEFKLQNIKIIDKLHEYFDPFIPIHIFLIFNIWNREKKVNVG